MDLSTKDFFPLIGTIITVLTGYLLISVQIRKNRRSKWIEDFRKESAKVVTLFIELNLSYSKGEGEIVILERNKIVLELTNSTVIIGLYLSENNDLHNELRDKLSSVLQSLDPTSETKMKVSDELSNIATLAKRILDEEQEKI